MAYKWPTCDELMVRYYKFININCTTSLSFFSLTGLMSGGAGTSINMQTDGPLSPCTAHYGSGNEACVRVHSSTLTEI